MLQQQKELSSELKTLTDDDDGDGVPSEPSNNGTDDLPGRSLRGLFALVTSLPG